MPQPSHRRLSIVEAARLLYRTDAPSDQQIGRVFERMKAGAIRVGGGHGAPRGWTTTEQDLADYVAAEMLKRQGAEAAGAPRSKPPPGRAKAPAKPPHGAEQFQAVYHSIWRDAFLAVLLRRRIAHRSEIFHRYVLAGQIVLLASLTLAVIGAVRFTIETVSPVQVAVERWIDENTDSHAVIRWHAQQPSADGSGEVVEVEYRYTKDSKRMITTRRTLLVVGDQVSEVSLD